MTSTLRDRCRVNTNVEADTFVGIKSSEDDIVVNFPLGFKVADSDKDLRKDILLLLSVLSNNTERKESQIRNSLEQDDLSLPIHAYLYVIYDYYSRGYYKEAEVKNEVSRRGKINWGKTIKTQRTYVSDDEIYYLDFVTRRQSLNENELVTLIHKYCVYESFDKLGWLFTSFMPLKPTIKTNKRMFSRVIRKKLNETFNDQNRELFKNLLAIIESTGDKEAPDFKYGTSRFEYIWEAMIDKAYGISNKIDYFPSTKWIINQKEYDNSYLKPDTIMLAGDKVFVIDAKYYKYGSTKVIAHLPDSESINKQITYGEYIAKASKFQNATGENPEVYNAFIMPYDSHGDKFHTESPLHHIGNAISEWKSSDDTDTYEDVVGILLDIKTIMQDYSHNENRLNELAEMIEKHVLNQ